MKKIANLTILLVFVLTACPKAALSPSAARDATQLDHAQVDSSVQDRPNHVDSAAPEAASIDRRRADSSAQADAPAPDSARRDAQAVDRQNSDRQLADQLAADSGAGVTYVELAVDGDIAQKGRTDKARAAALLISSHQPAVEGVILSGDNARYVITSLRTLLGYYQAYYQPADEANWGQFDHMTFPQLGNHEYGTTNPQGYFDYFAPRLAVIKTLPSYSGFADDKDRGYYSVNINGWHLISLNSNCVAVTGGGCDDGSEQLRWLNLDLAEHAQMPIMAAWHHPRYACGGSHGNADNMQAIWAALYDAGADFVFNGHDHYYQRYKPLNKDNPQAAIDEGAGLVEFITGSGGVDPYSVCDDGSGQPTDPRVAKTIGGEGGIGVLFLRLGSDGSYSYEYKLIDGSVFDSGSGFAHNAH